ncbi:MAG TPA: hypothetical protein VF169_02255 [Albitalea sp.]|uniref:hypothetical protein n=1 Tax=Piscinibacter sp. TaxID=1903157 RepID=UPI002ED09823
MIATSKPFGQANNLADDAAQGADGAIRTTQRVANEALSTLSDKVEEARDRAAPVVSRVAAKAEELARRSADAVRDTSQQVKERAYRASDLTVGYIKDEPVKSILIAVAAGAALMALFSLLGRDRR